MTSSLSYEIKSLETWDPFTLVDQFFTSLQDPNSSLYLTFFNLQYHNRMIPSFCLASYSKSKLQQSSNIFSYLVCYFHLTIITYGLCYSSFEPLIFAFDALARAIDLGFNLFGVFFRSYQYLLFFLRFVVLSLVIFQQTISLLVQKNGKFLYVIFLNH